MVKNLLASAGDTGSIPASGSFPGDGNGNPLQYSCLENPMDRRAGRAIVHGVAKSRMQLSEHSHTHTLKVNNSCQMSHTVHLSFLLMS